MRVGLPRRSNISQSSNFIKTNSQNGSLRETGNAPLKNILGPIRDWRKAIARFMESATDERLD
ncbi:hypothetical protein MJO28_000102 [Puccinia striiformis f. sp. tritici]|uniref:Uncharacterized protein n=1 Tax=Puccinia striiformis f. sp. tritici TaxID=168172 RepID=A0ACC0EWH4_9BASI|nr:hypothetical protein MJO28_000102 [Puccinia striiformis f. sp. tritici]